MLHLENKKNLYPGINQSLRLVWTIPRFRTNLVLELKRIDMLSKIIGDWKDFTESCMIDVCFYNEMSISHLHMQN